MLFLSVLAQLAFTAVVVAQTPNGFVPSAQTPLSIVYPRNITVPPPGVLLQRADAIPSQVLSTTLLIADRHLSPTNCDGTSWNSS
jgi:hypothetical protein